MDSLLIASTDKTPSVRFMAEEGRLQVSGKSLLDDAVDFYTPVIKTLQHHLSTSSLPVMVDIYLIQIHPGSAKCILDLLKSLETSHTENKQVLINWYYEKGNKDMYLAGENYQSLLNLPFNLKIKQQVEIDLMI